MQRIWITGSSGSGKTTLANAIGEKLEIPVTHRDQISWMENWTPRPMDEQIKLIQEMTAADQWIFDSNMFSASKHDGRLERCDTIIHLEVNRLVCLYRAVRRYLNGRRKPRKDLPRGCEEDIDLTLVKYILLEFPSRKRKNARLQFFKQAEEQGKTVIFLHGLQDIEAWKRKKGIHT